MFNSANQAWYMYPGLSHGAYECLHEHGTPEQKALYLPKLVSGEWTGTMCLTEPHCGTDLGLLRTKAVPNTDGSWSITGNKIFISAGEHGMSGNILHLVLARIPDAPVGTKGISLFLVPKFLPDAAGNPGARNPIHCDALEDKMGIHGNSTCQISLDGATGWMIGEPNKGLNAMFVMMNAARLGVGMQSLGLTEAAYQNALAYARERLQMRSLSGVKAPEQAADPIIVHPDVRRMLLTAKAYAEGGRAFSSFVALMIDRELNHPDEAVRKDAADMVALLTPIIKAFMTDNGWIATSEAMQVHGGPRLHHRHRHRAVRARCPHQHDLRRHQHHPVARPARTQDPDGQRRQAEEVRRPGAGLGRGERHRRGHERVHHAAGRSGRQGQQADHGNRHESLPEPGRSRRRRGALPARGRPSGLQLLLRPAWRSSLWRDRIRAIRSTRQSLPLRASTSPDCCPRPPC
jgi:alkylation response protein AidB-like acyl-CoA dehydrogenase